MPSQNVHEDTFPEITFSHSYYRPKADPTRLDSNIFIFPLWILDPSTQGELNKAGKWNYQHANKTDHFCGMFEEKERKKWKQAKKEGLAESYMKNSPLSPSLCVIWE